MPYWPKTKRGATLAARAPGARLESRESAAKRGYGRRWRNLRAAYLKSHPLCVHCAALGDVEASTQVDHVVPRRKGGTDADDNLQALCDTHHSQKTARGQ